MTIARLPEQRVGGISFRHNLLSMTRTARAGLGACRAVGRFVARRRLLLEPLESRVLLAVLPVPSLYATIQAAIDAASTGDTIDISAGTYRENITVQKSGITIQGAGWEQTIIDGQRQGSVVTFSGVDNTTMLTDCTVTNGLGLGGGIRIENASPIIRHNTISSNAGEDSNGAGIAGGIFVGGPDASPVIVDNIIRDNSAHRDYGGYGGGIFADGARPVISYNQILNNDGWAYGGAIYAAAGLIDHNVIKDNRADYDAGIVAAGEGVTIQNNLIARNYVTYSGRSVIRVQSGITGISIVNNTIIDNVKGPYGGSFSAISVADACDIRNNIVAFNDGVGMEGPATTVAEYNLTYENSGGNYTGGVIPGTGSLSGDPQFVDRASGDYRLAAGSLAINAGDPDPAFNDPDGSRNDLGYAGGTLHLPGFSAAMQQRLVTYATATLQYFLDSRCNNALAGITHSWFGASAGRVWNSSTQQWVTYPQMPRGYGSYFNVNEATLGFVALAAGYKMGWLADSQLWTRIQTGLSTLRGLQISGDAGVPNRYLDHTFYKAYQTVGLGDVDLPPDQIYSGENMQSSDDNALAYLNLWNLKGLIEDLGSAVPGQQGMLTLIDSILGDINLKRFLINNSIVHEFKNGIPSTAIWDRVSAEGPLILAAMLLAGQISVDQFYDIAPSFQDSPVIWDSLQHGQIPIAFSNYHSAMFMDGLRAIHGMPTTAAEFAGVNFEQNTLKPVLETQMDYALARHYEALGSQVMSQTLDRWPLVDMPQGVQAQFPGNEDNEMPIPNQTQARATAPHAWFVAMNRPLELDPGDAEQIVDWASRYETQFFTPNGLGWQATIPWQHDDTTYTWTASDGTRLYSDGGQAYEALNSAYIVLSIFDALNPARPLASYNLWAPTLGAIARYFDSGRTAPLPSAVVQGTPGDDNFSFSTDGATYTVTFNGVTTTYDVATVNEIRFDGLGGNDRITITGGPGTETATLGQGSGIVIGPGYTVALTSIEEMTVDAGPGDNQSATIEDGGGNDIFTASYDMAKQKVGVTMSYGGVTPVTVWGFQTVEAKAVHGGTDKVLLNDGPGNDTFTGSFKSGTLEYAGGTKVVATGFDNVNAYANSTPGDTGDQADLYDATASTDQYIATPSIAKIVYGYLKTGGPTGQNWTSGFNSVVAHTTPGSPDVAQYYDSATANDTFTSDAAAHTSSMTDGATYSNSGEGFKKVYAWSSGGVDLADIRGTTGTDTAVAALRPLPGNPTSTNYGYLLASTGQTYAYNFAHLKVDSVPGAAEKTHIVDSSDSDLLAVSPTQARLTSQATSGTYAGRWIEVNNTSSVYVTGGSGTGRDAASVTDSALADIFWSQPKDAHMAYGTGAFVDFKGFADETVSGGSNEVKDTVYLYDSATAGANDTLTAGVKTASMSDAGGSYSVATTGFSSLFAYSKSGQDKATLSGSAGNDLLTVVPGGYAGSSGQANAIYRFDAVLTGGSQAVAFGFRYVEADAGAGGTSNIAYVLDSPGNDVAHLGQDVQTLETTGTDAHLYAKTSGFDQMYAKSYSTTGRDTAIMQDTAGNDFFFGSRKRSYFYYPGTSGGGMVEADVFDVVDTTFSTGNETAYLEGAAVDTFYNDLLRNTTANDAILEDEAESGSVFRVWLHNLDAKADKVNGYLQAAPDKSTIDPLAVAYLFTLKQPWNPGDPR